MATVLLSEVFLEGLCLAYDAFGMSQIKTQIAGIEKKITQLERKTSCISAELESVKKTVDRLSNFQMAELRDHSHKLLGSVGKATAENADIVSLLVSSLSSHLTAIIFKGPKRKVGMGLSTYRGFVAGTQFPEKIFQTLGKLKDISEITDGKIVTSCIESEEHMKAAAVAIAAFFKLLQLLDVNCSCGLADNNGNGDEMGIVIRFEGCYSLSDYSKETKHRKKRIEIIRSMRRNVYILGPNGTGKSTWGNLISGQNLFEVGRSNHTTMIPQSCDISAATEEFDFRLWDTPGLFDGSEQQGHMQDYMNREIDVNGYCSGVVFVFPNSMPASETTTKILEYAIKRFGPFIKENYFAIINDFHNLGDCFHTYSERLGELGFQLSPDRVFVSDGKESPNADALRAKQVLCKFKPTLVTKHREVYEAFINNKGDARTAVRSLFQHGKEELRSILRRGKISLERFTSAGPAKNTSVPRDVIRFKQNSKGFLSRTLGIGTNKILEDRSVKLKGGNDFITFVLATLNQEYSFTQVNLFTTHILPDERYILMHTPNGECDYELWDTRRMKDEELRELIARNLMGQIR